MIINKYNKSKEGSNGGRGGGGNIYLSTSGASASSGEASKLLETHLIYGQPFNGTQDVDGDLTTSGNITADGNVKGKKFIGDVDAENVNTTNIKADSGNITSISGDTLNYKSATLKDALIDILTSVDITTENLTVTKQAHFFELIIDKIKAAGGAIMLTPADGFKVDKVKLINHSPRFYKLYFKATDGEKAISNMWRVGDQALCQTFNNAQLGTSYDVSNKYYWSLVTQVGTDTIDGEDYHYIQITGDEPTNNKSDYDGVVNPEEGDEIVMLGYRGSDDSNRQSAIYISSYDSIDPSIKAPLLCHYKGINNFDLKSHKYTYFAANGSEIRGNIKMESGQDLKDALDDISGFSIVSNVVEYAVSTSGTEAPASGWSATIPYTPPSQYLWTRTTITFSDGTTNVSYSVGRFGSNGSSGKDGEDGKGYTDNLLLGTQDFSGEQWVNKQYWTKEPNKYLGLAVYSRSSDSYGMYQTFNAVAGETYTFSAYVKSDGGDVRYYFTISGGGIVTPLQKDVPEGVEWSRQGVTFKCTESGEIACRVQKASGTGAIYVAGLKLEYGENPNPTWNPANSELKGADAEFYKLVPLIEKASPINGDLLVDLEYQLVKVKGDTITNVDDVGALRVRLIDDKKPNEQNYFSYDETFQYYNECYLEQFGNNQGEEPDYFKVELVEYGEVLDRRLVPVVFPAMAVLEITDQISAKVSNNRQELLGKINTNTNNISTLTQRADSIEANVKRNTTYIDSIDGSLQETQADVTNLQITAQGLTSTVNSIKDTYYYDVNNLNNWGSGTCNTSANLGTPFDQVMNPTSNVCIRFRYPIPYTNETYLTLNSGYQALITYYDYEKKYLKISSEWLEGGDKIKLNNVANCGYFGLVIATSTFSSINYSNAKDAGVIVTDTKVASSLIKQTAQEILLKVDDVALQINNKKIILDGDTEINGSLTMDNTDQGFILKGDAGTTTISPQSIGSYADFTNRAITSFPISYKANKTCIQGATTTERYTYDVGQIPANTPITIRNGFIKFNGNPNDSYYRPANITYSILKDGVKVKTISAITTTTANVMDYTTAQAGKYSIQVDFDLTTYITGTYELNIGFTYTLPASCFSLIGYDGTAMNFGSNRTVYFGSEGTYISYGNNRIKVDANGVWKYGGFKSNVPAKMVDGAQPDTAYSRYVTEYAPIGGCVVRAINSQGNSYLQPNDEFLSCGVVTGTLNIYLPSDRVGRKVYISYPSYGGSVVVYGGYNNNGSYNNTFNVPSGGIITLIYDGFNWVKI